MNTESRLQVLLDHLPAMIAYWDRNLRNTYANKAYVEWFGISPRDMVGRHISEVIGAHLYAANRPYLEGALSGAVQTFNRAIVDASGVPRHTEAHYIPDFSNGAVAGFFVLVFDITDLKRVRDELREAQRIGKLGSWTWDAKTDRTTWSPELYRLFGRSSELQPPTYSELARYYTPESWQVHNAGVARALETGEPYELEMEFVRENGTRGWLIAHAQAQCDLDGAVIKLQGTAQDVTERKKMELDLLASRNQLRDMVAHNETTREEERKHIARELHDELGQLLSALNMDVGVLRMSAGDAPKLLKTIDDMQSLVDKIFQVTRSVTTSLRPGSLDFGLVPALEWLVQDFSKRWGLHCTLHSASEEELSINEAQAAAVFRIAQESLTNVARHARASAVAVSLACADKRLSLCVQDNGCGFDLAKLSQPHGFGLLSMRERALSLGGEMQIDTAVGQGTSILIDVPIN